MIFKKSLSVFLAVLMLMSALTVGFYGAAAGIDMNTQYNALADAMQNEYVRDLTNYTIVNISDSDEGFSTEANGFVYEHRVIADDNAAGDILKAANIFYYIAEHIMSTTYGSGYYDASLLLNEVVSELKTRFAGSEEAYYEDFYGNRYYPTEEELAAYQNAVSLITLADKNVSEATLTSFNIYFIEKDYYSYFNVETILKYFMGNVLKINAGNWYHKFLFVVKTSVDTCLKDSEGINNLPDTKFPVRTAVYAWDYVRTYDETGTKARYAFKQPSADEVYKDYNSEFSFGSSKPTDLSKNRGLTSTGQASAFFIREKPDTTTIPVLLAKYALFEPYIKASPDENGNAWDARFSKMTEAQLASAVPNASEIVAAMSELTATYSNDALIALFGKDLGNMITLEYILKPISQSPTRVVRDPATYTATADKLNAIVRDMDALVYSEDNPTAQKVGTIVKQFFNTDNELFAGTDVSGMDFESLHDLVGLLLNGLVFNDGIINTLVTLLYPLVTDLLSEEVIGKIRDIPVIGGLAGTVSSLINSILENNELAIYPKQLGERLEDAYTDGRYAKAIGVLKAAGDDWEKLNVDALHWGVDDAPLDKKAEVFTDALCAALGGFRLLLVTVMCGDAEYKNNARKNNLSWASENQFTEFYDKLLINIGQNGLLLRSQGGYTKLIVPLFRVLGIPEMSDPSSYGANHDICGYYSPKAYHKYVDYDGDNCLRLIVEPIVYWATHILAERPFETIWNLIPNLVYFFTRTSSVAIADDWTDNTSDDDTHDNYTTCQVHSLSDIMDHVYVQITIIGINVYNSSIAGFLSDKMGMLQSVNALLNEVLSMEYVVGESGVLNTVAYANNEGIAVMPDSYEYATNSAAYPNELQYVYANADETEFRADPDDVHNKEITNPEMLKAPYKIPQLQEAKLTSVTTLKADGSLTDPNAIGVLNNDWNTIDVRNPGVVLMYVLRFVLSALGYRYDISDSATDTDLPMLIECFGLEIDNELFQGLNLKDIIYNVMLHPDEAICALLELFYSNETGNYYNNRAYKYPINPIDYHNDVLLNKEKNPTLTYGNPVRYTEYWTREYAQDTINNAEELAQNILSMLGVEGFEDGFGPFLANLLNENVFNDKLMNTLFNTIYQLLGGLNDTVGFDIEVLLDAALGIKYDPATIGRTLEAMAGPTPASYTIRNASSWNSLFTAYTETDPVTGEETAVISDINLDWQIDIAKKPHYQFLKTAAALLAPAAFVFRFLLMDQHLDILGLIDIDAYAGYQYAFIGLLEMLSCPNILIYETYYKKGLEEQEGTLLGDANVIYYLLSPVLSLIDKVYEDPLTTLLGLIPNLLFFISIGGLNDLLNNLVHFAYVLLDILKPIVNGYDLLNGLISNLEIGGLTINLSLPLDVDFNGLISDLIGTLVGDSLTIEGVKISLPYIDFHTLCAGTFDKNGFASQEDRKTVRLDSADGGDLLTALLRLVFEVLFMDENKDAIAQIIVNLADNGQIDAYDKDTLLIVINELFDLIQTYDVPDMLLFAVYFLVTKLTPLSGTLAEGLKTSGMTITDLFENISDPKQFIKDLVGFVSGLLHEEPTPGEITDGKAATGLLARIKAFFEKLNRFFRQLFGIA